MDINREITKESEPLHPNLKDSWFKAYKDGNLLLPIAFQGQRILVAIALINEPPESWQSFANSTFSDKQIKSLSEAAKAAHKAKGLKINFKTQDLQRQWFITKAGLKTRLAGVLGKEVEDSNDLKIKQSQEVKNILEAFETLLKKDGEIRELIMRRHRELTEVHKGIMYKNQMTVDMQTILNLVEKKLKDENFKFNPELLSKVVENFFV